MPTSMIPRVQATRFTWVVLGILEGLLPPPVPCQQLPAFFLNEETEVQSIRFRFLDSETLSESTLMSRINLTQRGGAYRLKKAFSHLPLVPEPEPHPFDPLTLQRDVARLRSFYQGAGFPEADIRYEVAGGWS